MKEYGFGLTRYADVLKHRKHKKRLERFYTAPKEVKIVSTCIHHLLTDDRIM